MRRVALAIAVLAAACHSRTPSASCPEYAPVAQSAPFLWRAQNGGGPVLWLYGTIHDVGFDAIPAPAVAAFASAPRLVTELGDVTPDPDVVRDLIRYRSGPGIDQQLPADDWYDLRDALMGTVKEDTLRRLRPWYAISVLTGRYAPSHEISMDVTLAKRARSRDIAVDALESWQDQIKALDGIVTVADLREAIHARPTMRCELDILRRAYDAGDLAMMEHLLVIPRTAETLLWNRNRAWLPALVKAGTSSGGFVAVGLGHMLGDNGLPALLGAAGFTVTRVPGPR